MHPSTRGRGARSVRDAQDARGARRAGRPHRGGGRRLRGCLREPPDNRDGAGPCASLLAEHGLRVCTGPCPGHCVHRACGHTISRAPELGCARVSWTDRSRVLASVHILGRSWSSPSIAECLDWMREDPTHEVPAMHVFAQTQGAQCEAGARWTLREYQPSRGGGDHDHCEYCGAKLSALPGDLQRGYVTSDDYHWICEPCFADFRDELGWAVD